MYGQTPAQQAGMQPPHQAAYQAARNKNVVALAVLGAFVLIGGLMLLMMFVSSTRSYIIFDGDPSYRARVDGKDLGTLSQSFGGTTPKALVRSVPGGKHHVEIVDASGKRVVDANLDVPEKGWRAVMTTNPGKRFAVVRATYGHNPPPPKVVPLVPGSSPNVWVVPPSDYELTKLDLDEFDQKFPASMPTRNGGDAVESRVCSLDAKSRPVCF